LVGRRILIIHSFIRTSITTTALSNPPTTFLIINFLLLGFKGISAAPVPAAPSVFDVGTQKSDIPDEEASTKGMFMYVFHACYCFKDRWVSGRRGGQKLIK